MKAVVIGLDGATLDRIVPAVERGELPAFARLMREGAWGPLRSTVPPDSPSAWASFATGVDPGRHGVFGFMARRPGAYEYEIGSSAAVRAPTFWRLAGSRGARVGVINVPFTYPPQPVNGFVVAGMLTPDLQSPFTHPRALRDELLREIPDYSTTHGLGRMQDVDPRETLAQSFAATIAMRERAMNWLAAKYQPDLLVCVFTVLDRLQHFLWADMDENHPQHDPSASADCRKAIPGAYRLLDGVVGRVIEAAGGETLLMVLSDHGFEAVARTFFVNAWLADRGLLALTGQPDEPTDVERRKARDERQRLKQIPGAEAERERLRARRLLSDAFVHAIDWPRTRAWFGLDRGLWLNVEGRDPEGCIDPGEPYERLRSELIDGLQSLRDPETGRLVVQKVWRREDLYKGNHVGIAPDLILEPARDEDAPASRYTLSERLTLCGSGRFTGPSGPITGNHTPEGVVFLRGPRVRGGERLVGARIVDAAPTILAAMRVAGAGQMDGRSLVPPDTERLEGPAATDSPAPPPCRAEPAASISDDERRTIEERLKNLGYLD